MVRCRLDGAAGEALDLAALGVPGGGRVALGSVDAGVKAGTGDSAGQGVRERGGPAVRGAYVAWLARANFDAQGAQKARLSELVAGTRA